MHAGWRRRWSLSVCDLAARVAATVFGLSRDFPPPQFEDPRHTQQCRGYQRCHLMGCPSCGGAMPVPGRGGACSALGDPRVAPTAAFVETFRWNVSCGSAPAARLVRETPQRRVSTRLPVRARRTDGVMHCLILQMRSYASQFRRSGLRAGGARGIMRRKCIEEIAHHKAAPEPQLQERPRASMDRGEK